MRNFIILAVSLFLCASSASAASIVQDYSTGRWNIANNIGLKGIGQTFIAPADFLSSITVHISPYPIDSTYPYTGPDDPTISFAVFSGLGLTNPNTKLFEKTIDVSSLDIQKSATNLTGGGYLSIDISSLNFSQGLLYSFALLNDTAYWSTNVANDGNDYYTDGALFSILYDNSYSLNTQNIDLEFTVSAVPLPPSLLLFGSALLFLPALRKKFPLSGNALRLPSH